MVNTKIKFIMRKSSKARSRPRASDNFLSVLGNQEDQELDSFIQNELHLDKNNKNLDADISHEKLDELWVILLRIFESQRDKILCETHHKETEVPEDQNTASTEKSKHNIEKNSFIFVKAIVKKIEETVSKEDVYIPDSMTKIMTGLQSFLVTTSHGVDPKFKDEIVHLVELWSKAKQELKASMILLVFQFLLAKTSVRVKSVVKNDIRRVWNFRENLLKLQLTSIGCEDLLHTLSILPANNRYIKSKDGCNFIAFLFTIHEVLVTNLHNSVKQVLPAVKRSEAESYGKIYTSAWIKATPEMRSVIEDTCVQNFMVHIFTIQRQGQEMSRLGQNILAILNQFHRYPVHPVMQKMLTDQYEPLLWRFLVSSNNLHRCNAAQVFFSVYPLRSPGSGAQARVNFEEKQHKAVQDMLLDTCHLVRIIAVKEAFTIMEQYWQSLPPECIQKWMKIIVSELAVDSSSADIRRHVFLGFSFLLNNVHSFEYVKEVLPQLRILIHDVNEKVRFAFVNLLLKLKECGMAYWTFVPLRHLIARLEVEEALIGEKIVKLIYDGFCGANKAIEQKVRRIMSLFILSQGAGRNFFYYSKPTMGKDDAVDLIVVILQSLKLFVKTCLEQDKTLDSSIASITDSPVQESKKGKIADKENIDTTNSPSSNKKKTNIYNSASFENPLVSSGFLDAVGILWTIHITELSTDAMRRLHNLCAECIPSFMSFFKGTDFYSSVLYLSSLVPSKTHAQNFHIISSLLSQVKVLTNTDDEDTFMALVQPLCSWDRAIDLIELVQESLHVALSSNQTASQGARRSARKHVTFRTSNELTPEASLQVLNAMFGYQPSQKKLLRKNYNQLLQLWTELAAIKELVSLRVVNQTPLENPVLSDSFLQKCMLRYAKLILILKNDESDFKSCQEFLQLLDWARDHLILHIPNELPSTSSASSIPFVVSVLQDLNYVAVQSLMCGIDEPRFYIHVAAFSKQLLKTGYGLMFVSSVSSVIGQLLTLCKGKSEEKDSMRLLRVVIPSLVTAELSVLSQFNYSRNYISPYVEKFSSVKMVISDVLVAIKSSYGLSSKLFDCVAEKLTYAIVNSYTLFLQETEDEETAKTLHDLPYVTSQLIGIFLANTSFRMVLKKNLKTHLESTSEDDLQLTAVNSILEIMETASKTQSRLSRPSSC